MSFDIPDCIYFEGLTKNKVEARDIDFKTNFIYSVLDKEKKNNLFHLSVWFNSAGNHWFSMLYKASSLVLWEVQKWIIVVPTFNKLIVYWIKQIHKLPYKISGSNFIKKGKRLSNFNEHWNYLEELFKLDWLAPPSEFSVWISSMVSSYAYAVDLGMIL